MDIKTRPRYKEEVLPTDYTEVDQDTIITIPNEATTIQDIFERSQAGFHYVREFEGANPDNDNFDDMDLEEFQRLDLAEQHEVIEDHREFLKEIKAAHKQATIEAEKKKEAASANESHGSSSGSDSASSKAEN